MSRDRNFVRVLEVDCSNVMHAIERARLRLLLKSSTTPLETVEFARAVIDEMGKIIDAKTAYDAAVAAAEAASRREREAADAPTNSPKPTVLN